MTALKTRLHIGLGLWLIATAQIALSQSVPPYEMVDSGFPAEDSAPIAWVDDHRLLFTGVELGVQPQHRGQRSYRGLKIATYLWDTNRNVITKFKDWPLGHLCTTKDYISYRSVESWEKRKVAVYAGKFGSESKLRLPKKYWFNRMSCRYFAKPPVWARRRMEGRWIQPLLDQHGFIDYGWFDLSKASPKDLRDSLPTFWSADGKTSKPLHIEQHYRQVRPLPFAYVAFANEYFARAGTSNAAEIAPVFYLTPDGLLRKVNIPKGPWWGGHYFAVRPGVFFISGAQRSFSEPGNAGAYLFTRGKMEKVVTGNLRRASVSLDGCKAAFVYTRSQQDQANGYRAWKEEKIANTIRMVDICKGAKE